MVIHTIEGASLTGTQCTSQEQVILRVRVASIFSPCLMSLPAAPDMLTVFIATKPLRNISCFGMLINMLHLVHYDIFTIKRLTLAVRQLFVESLSRHIEICSVVDS